MAKNGDTQASSSDDARARMVEARDRALSQLSALLASPDEIVVIPNGTRNSSDDAQAEPPAALPPVVTPETEWVPVAIASRTAGVEAAAIRSWYRAGEITTRRTRGERGAVLVRLADVVDRAAASRQSSVAEVELLGPSEIDEMAADLDELRDQLAEERRARADAERERDEARAEIEALTEQVEKLEDRLASPLSWSLDEVASRPGYRGRWARERPGEPADDLVPTSSD